MEAINKEYSIETGKDRHGRTVKMLYKIACPSQGGALYVFSEPELIKSWYLEDGQKLDECDITNEITLNDWSRWNTGLPKGQQVQISETIFYHLMNCLPPRVMCGSYFEVGEPDHHDENGRPIHRACWIEDDLYYTGYPKQRVK